MTISNAIYKMHRKYHIPTRIFTAILMQESRYELAAKGCTWGYRKLSEIELSEHVSQCFITDEKDKDRLCLDSIPKYIKTKVCSDFGISQINYRTIIRFGFNINKLVTDLEYSIEAGAKVLSDFQNRYEAKETNWWTRYNSSNKIKRRIYQELVEKYM